MKNPYFWFNKFNLKLFLILLGLLIILASLTRSLYLISQISKQKQSISKIKVSLSPTNIATTPTSSPTEKQIKYTSQPTPTSSTTPTPSLNKFYGKYVNGHGDKISMQGQKITITHIPSGTVYETSSSPEWFFPNLMLGNYRVKVAQIPGYNISLLTYIGVPIDTGRIPDPKLSDTTEIEINNERTVGMVIVYFPQSR